MGLFKDKSDINHITRQEENLKELAQSIKHKELHKLLYTDVDLQEKEHTPNHNSCSYKVKDGVRTTEKRICRCMFFYNNKNNERQLETCHKACKYPHKWKLLNEDQYKIKDYEVPPKYVVTGIGGVDLIITDVCEKTTYAVEVKPEKSNETIVRMIAEILTYVEDEKFREGYKPAICFFEGSMQHKQFEKLENKADLQYILDEMQIAVFYFSITKRGEINEFVIHRINR